jgi:hypothetical protein
MALDFIWSKITINDVTRGPSGCLWNSSLLALRRLHACVH